MEEEGFLLGPTLYTEYLGHGGHMEAGIPLGGGGGGGGAVSCVWRGWINV